MSYTDRDLESQPMIGATPLSPYSTKSLSALEQYQMLVGNVEKAIDTNDDSLYHTVMIKERQAKIWYYVTAVLIYFAIAAQIILCLGISVGAQLYLSKNEISGLAAINTGVAATIGVLKALGLPDKKGVERQKLQSLAARIRLTTRKLRAGINVDAVDEAEKDQGVYDQAEEEAHFKAADFQAAGTAATGAFKKK
jgi:hypothetical protein